MDKELSEFILKADVVPIHVRRYDAQINRLIALQDYTEDDVFNGAVSFKEFLRARDRKIKGFHDCIATMVAKENLLQFHNLGTEISFTEEDIEIHKSQPKYDLDALTFEEKVEFYHLWMKAKKDQRYFLPVIGSTEIKAKGFIEDAIVIEETPNISQIKQVEASTNSEFTLRPVDPVTKLQQTFNKMAAERFGEIGTLTEEERNLYGKETDIT
ncbi:MAG TPA: hypothetical protein VNT20_18340 [Flavisolibacter sp.]|jgi:hypothetical protein|nr:hypothetical protein [Flavisolibacter sp.]